ncbi:scarecrow-like protein 6 isoform X1 [Olea europaea var. sylvestris]|uniref:scarecrow-like protein 6 isoform X1 n=1 Tax=Olea europaea var. sylvestris TaxID=158386 RepID=UPI000C1D7DD1|nr:scarecrow-like protein 6 isoform X1 [Olea europaea var. sylvestris]
MKGMPLPFEFEGKGVDLELLVFNNNNFRANSPWWESNNLNDNCFLNSCSEPASVLDIASSPSGAISISSSTLSSSLGGGVDIAGGGAASTDTAGVAAVPGNNEKNPSLKWRQDSTTATSSNTGVDSELLPVPPSLEIGTATTGTSAGKCAMDEWESVFSESAVASPSQEQSILRWIMGDVDDPEISLNKVLQFGTAPPPPMAESEFNGGFGVVDQAFGADTVGQIGSNFGHDSSSPSNRSNSEKIGLFSNSSSNQSNISKFPNSQNNIFSSVPNNLGPVTTPFGFAEMEAPIFTPQMLVNHQNQHPQNPSFFLPLPYANQQEQNPFKPPQAKRHNPGAVGKGLEPDGQIQKGQFSVPGQELLMGRQLQQQQPMSHQFQLLPHYLQQRPPAAMGPGSKPKIGGDDLAYCHQQQQQQQQAIIDQLYKATELVQMGDLILAQEILARLNHQLSPTGKPFHRAAFYCKEALQLIIHNNNNTIPSSATAPHFSLIFKIGAYKSFSEISPLVQFANFTCNQALLEVLEGFGRIHIVDFDIGYGGQWASLMQELALRSDGAPSLKITAFTSPSTHDQLELSLTRENLIHFANEINVALEFEVMSIDYLNSGSWSLPFQVSESEAIAVNLPVGSLASYQLSVPLVLRFVKHLSPKIVVSVDRGCDRIDLPFPNHIIHALQSYSNLLESLDAVNVNTDTLPNIERFLLQPGLEKIVMGRFRAPEKTQHWRTLFLSSGFSPITFSNFTESQAECVVKRTPVRGFNVEKRQSSLVLCWQRKELISASAWRC